MTVTRQIHAEGKKLENHLHSVRDMLGHAMTGEAFDTLKKISAADELAVQTGSQNEQLEFWLDMFQEQQKGFKQRVEQGFLDTDALQKLSQAELAKDREDQKLHEMKAKQMLEGKLGGALAGAGGGDTSALDGALGETFKALREQGETRFAADSQALTNLEVDTTWADDSAQSQVAREQHPLNEIVAEKLEGTSQQTTISNLIDSIQRAQDKRIMQQKKILDDRAKAFSTTLLLGASMQNLAAPDLQALKKQATDLQLHHRQLAQRHERTEQNLRVLIKHLRQGMEVKRNTTLLKAKGNATSG